MHSGGRLNGIFIISILREMNAGIPALKVLKDEDTHAHTDTHTTLNTDGLMHTMGYQTTLQYYNVLL